MLYGNDRIYDWDDNKRALNIRRHGIDFNDVAEFDWDGGVHERSDRKGEVRFMAIGYFQDILHVVIYTERQDKTRVISFRRANKQEVRRYAAA